MAALPCLISMISYRRMSRVWVRPAMLWTRDSELISAKFRQQSQNICAISNELRVRNVAAFVI